MCWRFGDEVDRIQIRSNYYRSTTWCQPLHGREQGDRPGAEAHAHRLVDMLLVFKLLSLVGPSHAASRAGLHVGRWEKPPAKCPSSMVLPPPSPPLPASRGVGCSLRVPPLATRHAQLRGTNPSRSSLPLPASAQPTSDSPSLSRAVCFR